VYYQRGGMLSQPTLVPGTAGDANLAVTAFNGNDTMDIVTSSQSGGTGSLVLLHSDGTGFTQSTLWSGPFSSSSLQAGDLNGDGRTDILVASGSSYSRDESVDVFTQSSSGTFSAPTPLWMPYFAGEFASSTPLAVADLNGDGRPDIVAIDPNSELTVFAQTGT